jgi:ComF family protein
VDFISPPVCDKLGVPLPYDLGEGALSAAAIANPPTYDRARAAARFDGRMRQLIHRLKYGDRLDARILLARWMQQAGKELLSHTDLLVPVPLYRTRLWWRRFNQSAILSDALSELTGIPGDNFVLQRTRRTLSQVGLSSTQRKRNVYKAFQVTDKTKLYDKQIVLVDDVITTGATCNACAHTLKKSGARRVDVLAAAIVTDLQSI